MAGFFLRDKCGEHFRQSRLTNASDMRITFIPKGGLVKVLKEDDLETSNFGCRIAFMNQAVAMTIN